MTEVINTQEPVMEDFTVAGAVSGDQGISFQVSLLLPQSIHPSIHQSLNQEINWHPTNETITNVPLILDLSCKMLYELSLQGSQIPIKKGKTP